MKKSTLCAKNLAKSYKKKQVVSDVSYSVSTGEIVGLLGPNGAGKTTSFYMMVGLVKADSGQIFIDDTEITGLPMHQRAKLGVGYLPQEESIFRNLSVKDNIMAVLELRRELSKAKRNDVLNSLLDDFQIQHLRQSKGISLSGGERRRVEIARALAANPRFILLDEPFAGVDPISIGDIQGIISDLKNRNIGVLITDHNVRETLSICEQAFILGAGKIIAKGEPQQVLANKLVQDVYLGENFSL